MLSALVLVFALPAMPAMNHQGCPHEGGDHRWFGHVGCAIQRKMTIEHAKPPRHIWSIHVSRFSVKIDPRHPHLLVELPARRSKLWRFRIGYRWDANAEAYIFPSLAFKKVSGPMTEYLKPPKSQSETKTAELTTSPPSVVRPDSFEINKVQSAEARP